MCVCPSFLIIQLMMDIHIFLKNIFFNLQTLPNPSPCVLVQGCVLRACTQRRIVLCVSAFHKGLLEFSLKQ